MNRIKTIFAGAISLLILLYGVWLGPTIVCGGALLGSRRALRAGAVLASGAIVRRFYFGAEGRAFRDFWYEFRMDLGGANAEGSNAIVNLAIGRRTFLPSIYGKIATATYILTAVVAMLFNYLGFHSVIVDVFIYGSLVITLVSSFHYILHAARIIDAPAP